MSSGLTVLWEPDGYCAHSRCDPIHIPLKTLGFQYQWVFYDTDIYLFYYSTTVELHSEILSKRNDFGFSGSRHYFALPSPSLFPLSFPSLSIPFPSFLFLRGVAVVLEFMGQTVEKIVDLKCVSPYKCYKRAVNE